MVKDADNQLCDVAAEIEEIAALLANATSPKLRVLAARLLALSSTEAQDAAGDEPGDHDYTPDTPFKFRYSPHVGSSEIVEDDTLEGLGLDAEALAAMTEDDVMDAVAKEHSEWLLEKVQDNSCFEIGDE